MGKLILKRDVLKAECPWLERHFAKGEAVYLFEGHTFGCIGPSGLAVSEKDGQHPFFELPSDSLGAKQ